VPSASHAAAIAIATLLLAGCGAAPPPVAPPPVSVAAVVERDVTEWDEFTGRLKAVQSVEVRPRVSGYVKRIAFREGGSVKVGDLLFVIDPEPFEAEAARARAQLASARARAELARQLRVRADGLLKEQAISQEEFDERAASERQATEDVRAGEAQLRTATLNLSYTRVTSPIAGRVSRAEVTEGNLVSGGGGGGPATLLTTVVSLDPIYADFDGDEQVYLKYTQLARDGDRPSSRDAKNPVRMGLANEEGYPHEGYMVFVDNQLNPVTGTIRGRAVFENKDGRFTPGLFARLRLLGSGTHRRTLVVDRAIGTDQDRKFVLVVDDKNVANYRPVKLGRVIDGLRVVLDGVKAGEKIVVDGLQRVRPGMPVAPTVVPMDAAPAAPAT
jgi:RND family efflux transporter MFP subunit